VEIYDDLKNRNERKFVLEANQEFKAEARRNKFLGIWAAALFDYDPARTEKYILEVIASDMEEAGDNDVFSKLRKDFDSEGVEMSDQALRAKMAAYLAQAREEIYVEDKA